MNLQIHEVFELLWVAEPLLEAIVVGALVWRKAYRDCKCFFCYIIWQIVQVLILYSVRSSKMGYFYAYCLTSACSLALGFAVIHEIFLDVFRPYHMLRDLGSVLFKWAGLVMLLVAVIVSASGQAIHQGPVLDATIMLQRSIRVVQCGLILFLLLFSKYLGISWRRRSFGVALGFGAYATIELSVLALHLGAHISDDAQDLVVMVAYVASIGIWIAYSAMKATSSDMAVTLPRTQRWEQSLSDLHAPARPDSLIPMFEGMVERAFSRNHSWSERVDRVPLGSGLSDGHLSPTMTIKSLR
ncbi:MAG: hypothetical protein JOZ36_08930 [Acidobacteria bacterium]|nr:hypothetical protein [Acidobacteriota bacterium]